MHALIVGPRGVGKSTLISRVLTELKLPVFGFETKIEDGLADDKKGSPVYIYQAGMPHIQTSKNLVGYRRSKHPVTIKDTFDRYSAHLLSPVPARHIILMDEIGFMEACSEDFCSAVLTLLDGDIPVIAAVKDKDTEFLNTVRTHPNTVCFNITESNRDALVQEVLSFIKEQI